MNITQAFAPYLNEPGGHVLLNPETVVVAVGPEFCRMTYKDPSELIGHPLFSTFRPRVDEGRNKQAELRKSLDRVIATRATDKVPAFRFDIQRPQHLGGDWEERWWEISHIPLIEDGKVQYIVQRVMDQTTLHKVLEAVKVQKRRNYIQYAIACIAVIVGLAFGFSNQGKLSNDQNNIKQLAGLTCSIQHRALPANHELMGVITGIHELVTQPEPPAEKKLTNKVEPPAFRAHQEQIIHQLDRHLTRYLYYQHRVPSKRTCE